MNQGRSALGIYRTGGVECVPGRIEICGSCPRVQRVLRGTSLTNCFGEFIITAFTVESPLSSMVEINVTRYMLTIKRALMDGAALA
ncbi:hypothetical protein F2P81_002274 [Scophthalmus maximus]|uniref:Uncharacterized protein n=1 Tax=Scophthalmus maximus TaxID=52904 RepID=A0A6A4TKJ9_SCOMX|nr:hypothetical protein F2P81_002274 [Scophthalmus maximus]